MKVDQEADERVHQAVADGDTVTLKHVLSRPGDVLVSSPQCK